MQLLIVLAFLLLGGKSGNNILKEVKPVLESIGGQDIQEALKSAEEISSVISAVQSFAGNDNAGGGTGGTGNGSAGGNANGADEFCQHRATADYFPLKPVINIMDRDIAYSLSKYIS